MPDGTIIARNTSVAVGAKTAAPGLGASLSTLTTPPAGYYRIEVWTGLSGTLAAVDASNFELRYGNSVIAVLANSAATTASGNSDAGPFTFHKTLDGATTVTVNATAAATASSVYHCTLIATKLD